MSGHHPFEKLKKQRIKDKEIGMLSEQEAISNIADAIEGNSGIAPIFAGHIAGMLVHYYGVQESDKKESDKKKKDNNDLTITVSDIINWAEEKYCE